MSDRAVLPGPAPAASERTRRVDARRNLEVIIEAAVPVLCADPRASMQEIAAAAGLHRATVHRHFPSRDDLLDELRVRAYHASAAALGAVLDRPSDDPGQTLERGLCALITVGDRYRLYRYTAWRRPEDQERSIEIGVDLISALGAAREAGQVRQDLALAQLAVVVGGLIWALLPQVADGALTVAGAARTIGTMLAAPSA